MRVNRSDSAVSSVIGAVLILALLITVVAAVKLVYVPDMKKEAEAVHMQNVIDDVQNFKTQVSTIQATSTSGNGFTASTSLEMGGGSLPIIDPSLSSGTVMVDPSYGNISIAAHSNNVLITGNDSMIRTRGPAPVGRLVYASNNHYFVDQQLCYEGGMVVMSQPGGKAMISTPPISVTRVVNDPNTTAIVAFNPARITGSPQTLSSTGTSTIRTTMLPANNVINSNKVTNVTIKVQSDNYELWYACFDELMTASGLAKDTNYWLEKYQDNHTVSLRIQGSGTRDDIALTSVDSLVITQIDGAVHTTVPVTTTPSPSPSPSASATPSPSPQVTISGSPSLTSSIQSEKSGGWIPYTVDVKYTVTNTGSAQADNVLATCTPPTAISSVRDVVLVSGPAQNPRNIGGASSVEYVWRYTLDVQKNHQSEAIFALTAHGDNTNTISTTVAIS